jgi:hypothetical protein
MYSRHEEYTSEVTAPIERAFEHLDDQTRLSAHMNKRSWKMGWGRMDLKLDEKRGRAVGSHIILDGRVLGIHLYLDEVITERMPPLRKSWETIGEPRLLVIGSYRMGFELRPVAAGAELRVEIDYDLPRTGIPRLLGSFFGGAYAKWCTKKMALDAQAAFAA